MSELIGSLNQTSTMDSQEMKQVADDGSSSSSSSIKKVPKPFDLNLLPEDYEEEDHGNNAAGFYIEIFGSFKAPPQDALNNLTDNNKVGDANSNSNAMVVLPPPSFPPCGGANNNDNDAPIFNSSNTTSSAADMVVTPSNHPFDAKRRVIRSNGGGSSARTGTGTARHLRPRRPEPNFDHLICRNYSCRTRITPMWRRGPLGPKTLCNACGIQYKKQVTSRGSDLR